MVCKLPRRNVTGLAVALMFAATVGCDDEEPAHPVGGPDAAAPGDAAAEADASGSEAGGSEAGAATRPFGDLQPHTVNVLRPGGATVCSRGTEYAFFVVPGDRHKVIVEFEGGGACWDEITCGYAKSLFKESVDIAAHTADLSRVAGWYDHGNPAHPMKDWTHVFIPYCTGDIHWGDSVKTYGMGDTAVTINHKGAINTAAVLDWVYAQFPEPAKLFVTGCSAGGYGSIFWAPQVQQHYAGAKVYHFSDSAAGVITADFFQKSFPAWNVQAHFPTFLGDLSTVTSLSALYQAAAAHFPSNVFSQYNTVFDANQTFFYMAMGGKDKVEWSAQMKASIKAIETSAPNFRAFIAEGEQHCILPQTNFYDAQAGGTKLATWLSDMVDDRPIANAYCPDCAP
jgi:hypothetical protein